VIDQTLLHKGGGSQNDARRVTPRVGHQAGLPDLGAIEFGQPVDGFGEEFGGPVRLIPGAVDLSIPEAVVGAEIDHFDPTVEQLGNNLHGSLVRQGGEDQVGIGCQNLRIGRRKDEPTMAPERRIDGLQALARLLAGCDGGQFDLRMMAQDADQFKTRIAGRPRNGHA